MLSDKSFPVIEATLPLVGSRIGDITPKFYARLFAPTPNCWTACSAAPTSARATSSRPWPEASPLSPATW